MANTSSDPIADTEYVLGTGDAEIARLGLQHAVWRDDAIVAWTNAGFGPNQTIVDVGCGPGFATLDLADRVGAAGRVVAVDRSRRFLAHLQAESERRGYRHVRPVETDLTRLELDAETVDGAWIRWVLAFVPQPRDLLVRLSRGLRPGGVIALHEYFDYGAWRVWPRDAEFERFVAATMASWKRTGGEPDIAPATHQWLEELGLTVRSKRLIVELVKRSDSRWRWAMAFASAGPMRLAELGEITRHEAERMVEAVRRANAHAETVMITPGVAEIIAVKGATG
jgi:ubiquinone/menaquinone biosynthesis C-methylase UbiE